MKVIKNGIVKEISSESLLADYLCAGWKVVEEKKVKPHKEEIKPEQW